MAPHQIGMSIVIGEMLPIEKVASACGLMSLAQGIGIILGPPLAGFIYDHFTDQAIIFVLMAVGYVLSAITCWFSGYLYSRSRRET